MRFLHTTLLFILVCLLTGCSTERNTTTSRTFHNVTSRYNIYFNGRESIKSGLARIDRSVEEDFTQIIPLYKDSYQSAGNAARSDMENAILKATKLIQTHSITVKPKRRRVRTKRYQDFASREEFNNWIDDSYLVIGQARFYQHNFVSAIENFNLITRKFEKEDTRFEAMLGLARSYSEMERYKESSEILQALQSDRNFPKKLEKELAKVSADYYMKQKDYPEAVKLLGITIQKSKSRKEKARLQYVLGQLYEAMGETGRAVEAFQAVTKYNASYKMAFNARINALSLMAGNENNEMLRKELRKMLKDEKNEEFRDQIYYALANIAMEENDEEQAIELYQKSVASSVDNNFQLALSAVTLADIYFDKKDYVGAQAYYDTAIVVIEPKYPNYQIINARHGSLSHLVSNLKMVETQDSLQRLAQMPENERNALIDQWIADERERSQNTELLAAQQAASSGYYRANEYRYGLGRSSAGGGWYFYNPQTVSYGKSQFTQIWGKRKLEDNWRRINKEIVSFDEIDEFAGVIDSSLIVVRETDPMKREYYTQDIPVNDSLMAISHLKIRDALYNAGRIFKADFSDYPRSAESFEELNRRYPDNIYLLTAFYELYDLNELIPDKTKSNEYRELIIRRFPESNYAQYLQNPNFFADMQAKQDRMNNLYMEAFRDYKGGRYSRILQTAVELKRMKPDSLMLSKIDFMEAVAGGVQTNMQNFEKLLNKYVADYPKGEPVPLAKEILTLIEDSTLVNYQQLVASGYIHEEIKNAEIISGLSPENDEFGGKYSYDGDLVHYFVVAYRSNANVDLNRLRFDIANYNLDHYTRYDFDIESENLGENMVLATVRSLGNKEQALIYFRAIIRKAEIFRSLRGIEYNNFVISSTNYRQLLEEGSITDYLRFYIKNYSQQTGGDFSDEDYESPEELMARAQREDELLGDKGRFVAVDVPVSEAMFTLPVDVTQNFVIAVMDTKLSMRNLLNQFAEFNRQEFRTWNLTVQVKQAGDYQLFITGGLPGYTEGISYWRAVIQQRALFGSLGQTSYRNFLITDKNLNSLLENMAFDMYMDFFRVNYIQRAGQAPGTQQDTPVSPAQQDSGSQNQTPASEESYSGLYNSQTEGSHIFVLMIPSQTEGKQKMIDNINQFDNDHFAAAGLTVDETALDNSRTLIRVSGFADKEVAREYLSRLVRDRALFAPLENVDYRNFIITPTNLEIFMTRKNVLEYMDFYRKIYLGQ
ncbi:MAG: tetratricopeptide repeat protein [Prolixibacteraceae bacterium]|nr:tetratricopeptide repeat protein [Prolixibacteraceae bacterium]